MCRGINSIDVIIANTSIRINNANVFLALYYLFSTVVYASYYIKISKHKNDYCALSLDLFATQICNGIHAFFAFQRLPVSLNSTARSNLVNRPFEAEGLKR